MPHGVEHLDTWIKDIRMIHYDDLTKDELKKDTETVDGKFYELPHYSLIRIGLWTDTINGAFEWATMRPYNYEKLKYYEKLVGKQVKIEIKKC